MADKEEETSEDRSTDDTYSSETDSSDYSSDSDDSDEGDESDDSSDDESFGASPSQTKDKLKLVLPTREVIEDESLGIGELRENLEKYRRRVRQMELYSEQLRYQLNRTVDAVVILQLQRERDLAYIAKLKETVEESTGKKAPLYLDLDLQMVHSSPQAELIPTPNALDLKKVEKAKKPKISKRTSSFFGKVRKGKADQKKGTDSPLKF